MSKSPHVEFLTKPPLNNEQLEEIKQAWQPFYEEKDIELTLEDAQEIRDNLVNFFNALLQVKNDKQEEEK